MSFSTIGSCSTTSSALENPEAAPAHTIRNGQIIRKVVRHLISDFANAEQDHMLTLKISFGRVNTPSKQKDAFHVSSRNAILEVGVTMPEEHFKSQKNVAPPKAARKPKNTKMETKGETQHKQSKSREPGAPSREATTDSVRSDLISFRNKMMTTDALAFGDWNPPPQVAQMREIPTGEFYAVRQFGSDIKVVDRPILPAEVPKRKEVEEAEHGCRELGDCDDRTLSNVRSLQMDSNCSEATTDDDNAGVFKGVCGTVQIEESINKTTTFTLQAGEFLE